MDRNEKARRQVIANGQAPASEPEKPSDWFVLPRGADLVTRRRHVWGLLRWYHETVVAPQLGVAGACRRLWWRLTGQPGKLLSPWELIDAKLEQLERQEAAERVLTQAEP